MSADVSSSSDRELLARFADAQDQAAFSALVTRHGGLVWGVCRRVLRNAHEAEEAFQASFLVLARKASALSWQESITAWLYQVAYRTALKHRAQLARRQRHEVSARAEGPPAGREPTSVQELSELVDAELTRLPERLRAPLILCHVEGLSRSEAADRLGLSLGTIKHRLERGRALLRSRLVRRGVTLSAALLAPLLTTGTAAAAAPAALAATVLQGVGSLTTSSVASGVISAPVLTLVEGVLKTMFYEKCKTAALFLISFLTLSAAAGIMLADTPDRFAVGVRGEVTAVDTTRTPNTITIKLDEQDVLVNFDVKADAPIVCAYENIKLAELTVGSFVSLRLADDHRTVKEIQARGLVRRGDITEIDAAKLQVTVAIDEDDDDDTPAQPETFSLAKDARARIDDRGGLVADFEPGMSVALEFGRDKKTVTGLEGEWGRPEDVHGEIESLDIPSELIVVRAEIADSEVDLTFALVGTAKIAINGKPGVAADLKRGAAVKVRLADDRRTVVALRAVQSDKSDEEDD